MDKSLRFKIHENMTLEISEYVLGILNKHRQNRFYKKESGGQLFGYFKDGKIILGHASEPKSGDFRSRFSFLPNRSKEQREIITNFNEGLHFIGDWHTHPQATPTPSSRDIQSIEECTRESAHELEGFFLIIVGLNDFPEGLFVAFSDGIKTLKLDILERTKKEEP